MSVFLERLQRAPNEILLYFLLVAFVIKLPSHGVGRLLGFLRWITFRRILLRFTHLFSFTREAAEEVPLGSGLHGGKWILMLMHGTLCVLWVKLIWAEQSGRALGDTRRRARFVHFTSHLPFRSRQNWVE